MMHISYLIQFHVMSLLLNHQANCTMWFYMIHCILQKRKKRGGGASDLSLRHRLGDEVWTGGGAKLKVRSFRCCKGTI